jgi:hypothetical protein
MIRYQKENALLLQGGRNDKISMIYADLYFLTLDTLTWVRIETTKGHGQVALSDHIILPCSDTDFIILGGIDPTYKLSNKIIVLTFNEERIWAYSHNSRPKSPKTTSSPKVKTLNNVRLSATNSFLQK